MEQRQFEALLSAAPTGVDFDGLHVSEAETGYQFEVPGVEKEWLDEDDLRTIADRNEQYVTNWYFWHHVVETTDQARQAFLRRAEAAHDHAVPDRYRALENGLETTWGQLSITVSLGDAGTRTYEIRHEDDTDAAPETLDAYTDPLAARELVKHDDDGRYRPLKTAPTLPTGWRFADLGPDACVRTIEAIYPATIANWHREQEGTLDVTHYRECADRQTGIYDMIEGLEPHAVDWMAEACCDDSQCLKRREWQYDEEHELQADGGSGVFPCREPCSLVVAAARKWTTLESETPRTYEFELTPSEKNQLEELIDAVADDRLDEIREADVYEGANRYRTRFLRAKLLDDDGNLGGVPTIEDDD